MDTLFPIDGLLAGVLFWNNWVLHQPVCSSLAYAPHLQTASASNELCKIHIRLFK